MRRAHVAALPSVASARAMRGKSNAQSAGVSVSATASDETIASA